MKHIYKVPDYGLPRIVTYDVVRETPKMLIVCIQGEHYERHMKKGDLSFRGFRFTAEGAVQARIVSLGESIEVKREAINRLKERRRALVDLAEKLSVE